MDAEIAKCEKKLQLARLNLDKVRKVEAQPDYAEAVPENVRLINEDRVREITSISTVRLPTYDFLPEENFRGRGFLAGILEGDVRKFEIVVGIAANLISQRVFTGHDARYTCGYGFTRTADRGL